MAIENERESDEEDAEPVSAFHALAREVMEEDRKILDALDE